MSEWQEYTLGDIVDIKHGYAFRGEFFSETPTTDILVTPGNFKIGGGFKSSKLKYYNGVIPNDYILSCGDIIVTMTDLSKQADTLGYSAKVPNDPEKTFLHNQRIGLLKFKDKSFDKDFIYWLLRAEHYQKFVAGSATGATVKHSSPSRIRAFKFKAPTSNVLRKKISKILSNYDDLIENNLKRIKILEESARLTYEEWFLHFRIDGKKLDIDAESGLPFGWKRKSITSIGDVNKYSISVKTAPKKIKYIDISATETGVYRKPDYLEFKDAPSRARRKLNYGDTIFSTVRPNRKIYALVLEDDPTLIASTGFAVITPKDPLHFPYIYLSLSAQCFIDSAVAVAGGAAYPAINQSSFERLEVTVPSENILNKFCDSASFYLKTKNVLLNQNQLLIKARDILLPRLMTGIIDTDDMDIAA
jgi:type I restriction enzyme S subunit